jgi:hypothetical protein
MLSTLRAIGQHVQSSFTSFLSPAQCSFFDELIRLLYTPPLIFVSLSCLTSTTHLFGFLRKTAQSTICPNSWCELNSKTSELCFGSFLLGYVAQPSRSSFQSVWLLSQLRWMQQVARECQDRHHSCLRLNGLGDSLASSHSFVRKSWKKTHGG